MNISFLVNNFNNKGGTERVLSIIANGLINRNKIEEVSILSICDGKSPHYTVDKRIRVVSFDCENKNRIYKRIIIPNLIHKYIKNHKIDFFICVDIGMYSYMPKFKDIGTCKVIIWEHFNFFNGKTLKEKIKKRYAAGHADATVVLGDKDFDNYKKNLKRIKLLKRIYNPVPLNFNQKSNLKNKRIIAVGRLVDQKGFDILVNVWSIIKKDKISEGWTLDIFGEGPLREKLINQIDELNLSDIKINNFTNEIKKEYLKSSIFVLSSRFEGFVLVLMEAQSAGLPVVSFDIKEGPSEIIVQGENGFLIKPFDKNEMARKILFLMENENKRIQFSNNSDKIIRKFDTKLIINDWEELFEELRKNEQIPEN
ncbi:glycosyltransferase family 4 protein [Liquorilactobacillus mali]|nr:glycosyltransferase family 4 protein [Liquorilactobacillus mali]